MKSLDRSSIRCYIVPQVHVPMMDAMREAGMILDAWMLDPEWKREVPAHEQQTRATLESVADQVDHIAQLLGNARHSGIGSDLDGGFGTEQAPRDLNTIADLQRLRGIFERRGYLEEDIRGVLSGNWIRLLRETWGH